MTGLAILALLFLLFGGRVGMAGCLNTALWLIVLIALVMTL